MKAERIMMRSETDECLKCKLRVDIAIKDAELGELRPARARLCGVLASAIVALNSCRLPHKLCP